MRTYEPNQIKNNAGYLGSAMIPVQMVVDLFLFVTCVAMTPSEFWSNDVKFAKSSSPCHSFRL